MKRDSYKMRMAELRSRFNRVDKEDVNRITLNRIKNEIPVEKKKGEHQAVFVIKKKLAIAGLPPLPIYIALSLAIAVGLTFMFVFIQKAVPVFIYGIFSIIISLSIFSYFLESSFEKKNTELKEDLRNLLSALIMELKAGATFSNALASKITEIEFKNKYLENELKKIVLKDGNGEKMHTLIGNLAYTLMIAELRIMSARFSIAFDRGGSYSEAVFDLREHLETENQIKAEIKKNLSTIAKQKLVFLLMGVGSLFSALASKHFPALIDTTYGLVFFISACLFVIGAVYTSNIGRG